MSAPSELEPVAPGTMDAISAPARAGSAPWSRVAAYLGEQLAGFHGRMLLVRAVDAVIPRGVFDRLRGAVYRAAGFGIGARVRIAGPLTVWGTGDIYGRLTVGERTYLNTPAHVELNAPVRIGANCAFGHHLVLITSNHVLGPASARAGPLEHAGITIGDGVWVGACVTILPGVAIGDGAFVAAGAVVTKDVPPNARVSGNPATVLGYLPEEAPPPRRRRPRPADGERAAKGDGEGAR